MKTMKNLIQDSWSWLEFKQSTSQSKIRCITIECKDVIYITSPIQLSMVQKMSKHSKLGTSSPLAHGHSKNNKNYIACHWFPRLTWRSWFEHSPYPPTKFYEVFCIMVGLSCYVSQNLLLKNNFKIFQNVFCIHCCTPLPKFTNKIYVSYNFIHFPILNLYH